MFDEKGAHSFILMIEDLLLKNEDCFKTISIMQNHLAELFLKLMFSIEIVTKNYDMLTLNFFLMKTIKKAGT